MTGLSRYLSASAATAFQGSSTVHRSTPHRIDLQRGDMHLKRPPLPLEKRPIRVNKRSFCPDDDPLPQGYNDNGASFVDEGFTMRKVLEVVLADFDGKVSCPAAVAGLGQELFTRR